MRHSDLANPHTDSPKTEPLRDLPPLTAETIQRAREGLAAARDRHANSLIQESLIAADTLAAGGSDHRLSGEWRRCVLRSLIHTFFRVRVENPENLPNSSALLAANHLNHLDPLLILAHVPANPYYYILGDARTLYNKAWKRLILSVAKGVIPLHRRWKEENAILQAVREGNSDLEALGAAIAQDVPNGKDIATLRRLDRAVAAIFARGDGIILFPEGRLGSREGQLHLPLQRGAVMYALRAGVPIVPVGIVGTADLYLRKELILRVGQPLQFPQSDRPKPTQVQTAMAALEAAIAQLLPSDYREPEELKLFRYFLNHLFW